MTGRQEQEGIIEQIKAVFMLMGLQVARVPCTVKSFPQQLYWLLKFQVKLKSLKFSNFHINFWFVQKLQNFQKNLFQVQPLRSS